MPPKAKIPQPIDRPLSKAYLRGFKGWSTAYPPGQSDPATVRLMENMMVERNGALSVRPGLRYLSYLGTPDMDPVTPGALGTGLQLPIVGTQELFYLEDGSRALLLAVRELDGSVGFRAQLFNQPLKAVYGLTDPEVGFQIPQGEDVLRFSAATTYVKFLQINNRILALSDAGEPARLFYVGAEKWAKRLNAITVPEWQDADKLAVIHPDAAWINAKANAVAYNRCMNPTFEAGTRYWSRSSSCDWSVQPLSPGDPARVLELRSLPERTNLATSPLMNVAALGTAGWAPHSVWSGVELLVDTSYLRLRAIKAGRFYASSAKMTHGLQARSLYRVAVDVDSVVGVQPEMLVDFYGVDGVGIETELRVPLPSTGRYVSDPIQAPEGAVAMRVSFGGVAAGTNSTMQIRHLVVCKDGEPTTPFSGGSGTDYFWVGTANESASVYHPPASVSVWSNRGACTPDKPLVAGAQLLVSDVALQVDLALRTYTKDNQSAVTTVVAVTSQAGYARDDVSVPDVPNNHVTAEFAITVRSLPRGDYVRVNEAMMVPGVATLPAYFDGDTLDSSTNRYSWSDPLKPHQSVSIKSTYATAPPALGAETPAANSLISSDKAKNTYKMAFFYSFENEVGESTPSKLTEVRMMRAWSDWRWETPSATGEPSGTATQTAEKCADQLVVQIPEAVYDQAIAEGALRWNLYALTWSDQEPVPVTGLLVGERPLRSSTDVVTSVALPYEDGSWIAVTPARKVTDSDAILPTRENRTNYSVPPRHRSGLVAGDRMILVGDPTQLATIQWSSNRPAESTNFTPSKGGGSKTLTSGNLNIPADVVLWQNPQSVDTITILCTGDDGRSVAYYMAPASVTQGQSGMTAAMAFEQVTSTPGTESPYAGQVINNALYRPLDYSLLKSTANNYNINHKAQSDLIANMWEVLRGKQAIVTEHLDNRLYLLVHNPHGELLRPGCKGNEIWVYDVQAETGTWSRFLIQASALNLFSVRNRAYVGVATPDGLFYLDGDARQDDYVDEQGKVRQRPIPWYLETNTQGANRAHDAWAHLQGLLVTIGNFTGTMRYGVRGHTIDGKQHLVEKVFQDATPVDVDIPQWDVEDQLLVRRDFKEWVFFAGSVQGKHSWGQLSAVQYRYTPVSVNVGYEYGSVETFEYGANVSAGPTAYSANGIPTPMADYSRP